MNYRRRISVNQIFESLVNEPVSNNDGELSLFVLLFYKPQKIIYWTHLLSFALFLLMTSFVASFFQSLLSFVPFFEEGMLL